MESQNKLALNSIHHGDTLEYLRTVPDSSVDLVVSSPPYNIGKEYESKIALSKYMEGQREVLAECVRVLKNTGSVFWQVGSYSDKGILIPLDIRFFPVLEDLGLRPRNRIIWVRQHGLHAKRKFSARHETILWFTKTDDYLFNLDAIRVPQKWQNKKHYRDGRKGELSCNPEGKNPADIWVFRNVKHNHEEQTIHPCQFPEDLIARIVLSSTHEGELVLDPYMGAGTVAVVAHDYGRNLIGAEWDSSYIEVANRRLAGKPNKNLNFANLKTLRNYVKQTGEPAEKYRFDVQVGKKATDSTKSKIFSEEHHLEELETRLSYEESAFGADLRGEERPVDEGLNGKRPKISDQQLLF